MLKFVDRLSTKQIMDFFYGVGGFLEIKPSASEGMKDVFFENKGGKVFWYSIADNYISAYGFRKTSEDWKFYMLDIFGEEYWKEYAEPPALNSYVSKLTTGDIKELCMMNQILAMNVEEQKAFRKGTRRFKVAIQVPTHYERELVIGPHLNDCSGIPSMTEKMFMSFFAKRFGMDFIHYYIEVEKGIEKHKMEEYQRKCEQRVKEKLDYMVKTWENESKEGI